jgi:hypothetical protein
MSRTSAIIARALRRRRGRDRGDRSPFATLSPPAEIVIACLFFRCKMLVLPVVDAGLPEPTPHHTTAHAPAHSTHAALFQ